MKPTDIVYLFLILLLIWGCKIKFRPREFHEDYLSLDSMKSLRGLAAIGVILHHISQEQIFQKNGELSVFLNAGAFFVALFFFCSGYGLIVSLNKKSNYFEGFFKKRIVKGILIAFYVDIVIYGIVYLIDGVKFKVPQFLFNLSGLTMMNVYAWFPITLAFLYVAFYLIFKNVKNHKAGYALMFLFIAVLAAIFCVTGHFAWWSGSKNWWFYGMPSAPWWKQEKVFWFHGEWWVNSAPAFLVGIIYGDNKDKITAWFKKLYPVKLILLIAVNYGLSVLSAYGQSKFGYWTEYSGMGPGIKEKALTYLCQFPQLAVFPLLIIVIMMKIKISNPITNFYGKYSLNTYLMNLLAIEHLRLLQSNTTSFVKAGQWNTLIYAIAVILASTLLGVIEYHIVDFIKKKAFADRKAKKEV